MTTLVKPVMFGQFGYDLMYGGIHSCGSDTFKVGFITNGVTPAFDDPNPTWGGTGDTDYSTYEIDTGGSSYTGPVTLETSGGGAGTQVLELSSGVPRITADIITLAQDATGPANIYGLVGFNYTDTNKRCAFFLNFGAAKSIQDGPLIIRWNNGSPYIVIQLPQPA